VSCRPLTIPTFIPTKVPTVTPTISPTTIDSTTLPTTTTPTVSPTAECHDPSAQPYVLCGNDMRCGQNQGANAVVTQPFTFDTAEACANQCRSLGGFGYFNYLPEYKQCQCAQTCAPVDYFGQTGSNAFQLDASACTHGSTTSTNNNPEDECHEGELPTSVPSTAPFQTEKNDQNEIPSGEPSQQKTESDDDSECHEKNVCITTVWTISGVSNSELSSNGQTALLQTIANLLDVSINLLEFVKIVESIHNEQKMRVEVKISMNFLDYPEFKGNSTKLYNHVHRILTESCSDSFSALLRAEAFALHAEEINSESSVTKVDISSCIAETTDAPTEAPTETPSESPSESPIEMDFEAFSETPTEIPSQVPSEAPVVVPTTVQSLAPSLTPSRTPILTPSRTPSLSPSLTPTVTRTTTPTKIPTPTPTRTPTVLPTNAPVALYASYLQYKAIFKIKIALIDKWTNSCHDNLLLAIILILQNAGCSKNLQNIEYLGFHNHHRRLDVASADQEAEVVVRFTFNLDKIENSDEMYLTSTTSLTNAVATHQLDSGYQSLGSDRDSSVISVQFQDLEVNSADRSSSNESKSDNSWLGIELTTTNIAIMVVGSVFILAAFIMFGWFVRIRYFPKEVKRISLKMDGSRDVIKPEDFVSLTVTQRADDVTYLEDIMIIRHGLALSGSLDGQS
jgi:hypothetical protein